MKIQRVILGVAAVAIVGLVVFLVTRPGSQGTEPRSSPSAEDPSPSAVTETPSPSEVTGASPRIKLQHLTAGVFSKEGIADVQSTSPVTVPADSLVLVHLMSCCDHASAPRVAGAGLTFDLIVTHETGEKRHWVFGAANEGGSSTGPLTFAFDSTQARILWVVDAARNVELGSNGADAVVQTAWQNSMQNADNGGISLQPLEDPVRNAVVGFALAGSGTATDIAPQGGMIETGEAEVQGSSLIIDTFWKVGDETSVAATFLDDAGQPTVESWLFLAIELRARGSGDS